MKHVAGFKILARKWLRDFQNWGRNELSQGPVLLTGCGLVTWLSCSVSGEVALLSRVPRISLLVMAAAGGGCFLNSLCPLVIQFHSETSLSKIGGLSFYGWCFSLTCQMNLFRMCLVCFPESSSASRSQESSWPLISISNDCLSVVAKSSWSYNCSGFCCCIWSGGKKLWQRNPGKSLITRALSLL